ncbi:MAG: ATP-binding protein [Phycisphaerales bacterium]|nr:ATP-binding protein [Phycisphaerales bacterium]
MPNTAAGPQTGGALAAIPATPPHLRIEMLSQARYLSGARELVSAVCKRFGFDDGACGQIALAVDEALCNVIRHGYDKRADGRIWVSIWPVAAAEAAALRGGSGPGGVGLSLRPDEEPAGVRIVIDDQARQVDPESIKGRALEDIRPGGLGVFIIRQVMDHARFEKRAEGGMRLVMAKLLNNAAAASDPSRPGSEGPHAPPHAPNASPDRKG